MNVDRDAVLVLLRIIKQRDSSLKESVVSISEVMLGFEGIVGSQPSEW